MTPGADVQAIDALQDWHNALCLFRDEATDALSMISLEVRRAFDWIDEERKAWQQEARLAEQDVYQAKIELAQRKYQDFAGRIPDTSVQEKALARARARLEHAEDQVEVCRRWAMRRVPGRWVTPYIIAYANLPDKDPVRFREIRFDARPSAF